MGIVFYYLDMLLLVFFYIVSVKGDFMAMSEFENLSENHAKLVDSLQRFIANDEQTIVTLKTLLQNYEKEQVQFQNHKTKYFENPINCFKMLKRLTTDLLYIDQAVNYRSVQNTNWIKLASKPPASDKLKEAAIGIRKLQDMYNLKVSELSEGKIKGVSYGHPMTGSDCFHVGFYLIDNKLYKDGIPWMQEALKKITNDEEPLYKEKILSLIDKSKQAIKQENILKLQNDKKTQTDVPDNEEKTQINYKQCYVINESYSRARDQYEHFFNQSYKRLCNGENLVPKHLRSRLKCRYLSENHAFTKVGPLKVEELFLEPRILLIHDIITDFESKYLQESAAEHLEPARYDKFEGKILIDTDIRAIKEKYLHAVNDPVVTKIIRRGTYITGLNVITNDDALYVGNYGLGGNFNMHHDFMHKEETAYGIGVSGERIATVLYYLSDVKLGGSTVFPVLGVGMKPTKNQAIYWENVYPSGKGRFNTLHAACPVLLGSKWIATHWMLSKYQEFIRPCNLNPDEEDHEFYAELN